MTFPTYSGALTDDDDVSTDWKVTRTLAKTLKDEATALRDKSAVQSVTATELLTFINDLADQRDDLLVRALENIVVALNTVIQEADDTIALVRTVFPIDEQGRLLIKTLQPDGRTVDVEYSTADLVAVRAQIDTLLATMD